MTTCSVPECDCKAVAKSFCPLHYNRWKRHGDPTVAQGMCPRDASVSERLAIVLDRSAGPDGCWPFTGGVNQTGYGRMQIRGITKGVHVWAFEEVHGPVPDGLMVLHSCDNRLCGNPAHLRAGTHDENMTDKVIRNRQWRASGTLNANHVLSEAQVIEIRTLAKDGTPRAELAAHFNVSRSAIDLIVTNKRWKHIKEGALS